MERVMMGAMCFILASSVPVEGQNNDTPSGNARTPAVSVSTEYVSGPWANAMSVGQIRPVEVSGARRISPVDRMRSAGVNIRVSVTTQIVTDSAPGSVRPDSAPIRLPPTVPVASPPPRQNPGRPQASPAETTAIRPRQS
jgi:hypothetical protein